MTKKQNDLENAKDSWIKKFLLKHRIWSCVIFALVGLGLAIICYFIFTQWPINIKENSVDNNNVYEKIVGSLVIICAGLPISFYFWCLRNHDKLEQIEISQEQIKISREDNLFSDFSNATKLFLEKENIEANSVGLRLLMQIKNERNVFENKIDLMTPYKDLKGAKLQGADLQNANLQGADLRNANLQGADLRNANLQRTDLLGANLQNTKLQGADLQNVNLRGVSLIIFEKDQNERFSRQNIENFLKNNWVNIDDWNSLVMVNLIQKEEIYSFEKFSTSKNAIKDILTYHKKLDSA